MTFTMQAFHHCFCMSAIAKCRIKSCLARLDLQEIKDFLYHDGNMHSCRSISLTDDMFDRILIFLRIQLFIFFLKFARIFSLVSYSSFVWCLCFLFHFVLPVFLINFLLYKFFYYIQCRLTHKTTPSMSGISELDKLHFLIHPF